MLNPNIYHRTELAQALAARLLKPDILSSRDGLFITGIRRIGKTTFIQQDLIPTLQEQNALTIYVDLWANREGNSPTKIVLNAIRQTLRHLTSQSHLSELKIDLKVFSLTYDIERIGLADGVSIADALFELIQKIDTNIVLIIDEIQETLKSEIGRNLLTALKSARDRVNLRADNPNGTYLMIVGTGSHRSFVTAMASKLSQPFYGADRVDFPPLGNDFIAWQLEKLRTVKVIPNRETLSKGLGILGARPKVFHDVLKSMQSYTGTEVNETFLAICKNQARSDADEFLEAVRSADTVTRLLFTEIAKAGPEGCSNLFSSTFLQKLSEKIRKNKTISPSSIQAKLAQMQKKDWIYPVGYGSYSVSDPQARVVWIENEETDDFG